MTLRRPKHQPFEYDLTPETTGRTGQLAPALKALLSAFLTMAAAVLVGLVVCRQLPAWVLVLVGIAWAGVCAATHWVWARRHHG